MRALRRRSRGAVAAAVAAVLAVGGCGFPAEGSPRQLSADDVPYDLLSPTTAPQTTLGDEIAKTEAILYLLDTNEDVVSMVQREIATPKNASTVLRALFDLRPNQSEATKGLTNVITSQTRLLEVTPDEDGCTITLDLASYFPGLTAEEVSFAIAQIVFTLDHLVASGVRVRIFVEGLPEDVRTDEGKSVRAVSVADLQDFAPDERGAPASESPGEASRPTCPAQPASAT